jgi:riboflavin kinase/FMN adenylyltransferase
MFRIYRGLADIGPEAKGCALTIGNFDGVHAGHRRIFNRVVELAREERIIPAVLTFDPHPTKVLAPERAPRLLSSPDQRYQLMRECGIEQVFVIPFDVSFSEIPAREFVEKILVHAIGAKAVLVGANFHFGHKQAGDTELLRELGKLYGFTTEIIEGVSLKGRWVSSSEVRRLLDAGSVSLACRLLGRAYALEGEVVTGHGIGSKQTVPTLNLHTDAEIIPARGVYITRTHDLDGAVIWPSITNIGYRPTFAGDALSIETFLLEPLKGNTPDRIRVEFLLRLRDERKFDSPKELKAQILRDAARAQAYFRRSGRLYWKISTTS